MRSSLWFGLLTAGDVLFLALGYPGSLLLLMAPYLFIRNRSLPAVLFGGGLAAFVMEVLHTRVAGTYMIGVGLAVLLLHLGLEYLNWEHPGTRLLALLVYLITVELGRGLTLRMLEGVWVPPDFTLHLGTYAVGCLVILYRTYRRYRARGRIV